MENFFYDGEFYPDLESYMMTMDLDDDDAVRQLSDNWSIRVEESELQSMFELTIHDITGEIMEAAFNRHEDRFPEFIDNVDKEFKDAIIQSVDLLKLNSLIPKLYYPNNKFSTITKQDLIEYIS